MARLTRLPDEQGWYWCHMLDADVWCMAMVDTANECVTFFDAESGSDPTRYEWESGDLTLEDRIGDCEWWGPFTCPGGHFGGMTIVADEELHDRAKAEKKVIGVQHFDFRYCRDEGHGSSLTVSGLYTREEAGERIGRETREAGA